MRPQLEALANRRTNVSLRLVDIQSWDSPVARQYGVRRLPWLWLYADGKLVTKDSEQVLDRLNSLR